MLTSHMRGPWKSNREALLFVASLFSLGNLISKNIHDKNRRI